mmetsp:Transcript_9539/g.23412  ORF Transcript_9539/g.23412 Transcript_9539/m.23412 type:complete len:180 (+) Transcript_9539:146-685(+)
MVSMGDYALCQTACNDDHMSCTNDADVYFDTVDAGFEVLSELVNCNGRLARCAYSCHSEYLGTGAAVMLTALPGMLVGVVVGAAYRGWGYDHLQATAIGIASGVLYVAIGFCVISQPQRVSSRKRASSIKLKPQKSRHSLNNLGQTDASDVSLTTFADVFNSSVQSFQFKSSTTKNSEL